MGTGSGGGRGEGVFRIKAGAPTGAGVSLPIQPDERRFVSLRFQLDASRPQSDAQLQRGENRPYMVLSTLTERFLETEDMVYGLFFLMFII